MFWFPPPLSLYLFLCLRNIAWFYRFISHTYAEFHAHSHNKFLGAIRDPMISIFPKMNAQYPPAACVHLCKYRPIQRRTFEQKGNTWNRKKKKKSFMNIMNYNTTNVYDLLLHSIKRQFIGPHSMLDQCNFISIFLMHFTVIK